MTTTVVGVWSGDGPTLTVPAEAEAGDGLIAHVVVWPAQWFTGEVFTTPPAGWTEGANHNPSFTRGEFGFAGHSAWGIACYYKIADGTETSLTVTLQEERPDDPTAGYVDGVPYGVVVAVRSTMGPITLGDMTPGWSIGGTENAMGQNPPELYGAGAGIIIWAFSGNATAVTGYAGFAGTRAQLAETQQHSDLPFSQPYHDPPSGAPWYYERYRELLLTVESETMNPASSADRLVETDFAYGAVEDPAPWTDDIPAAGTVVMVSEPLAPAPSGWRTWIID